MIDRKTWKEFRDSGLIWLINITLHVMGWALVMEVEDGEIKEVYPARVKFRGFDDKNNSIGYQQVSEYMNKESEQLLKESKE